MYVSPTLVRLPNAPAPRRLRYVFVGAALVLGAVLFLAACADQAMQPNPSIPSTPLVL